MADSLSPVFDDGGGDVGSAVFLKGRNTGLLKLHLIVWIDVGPVLV